MIKILVIGEKCEDVFVYGEVNRLSPEAPIPVFLPKYIKKNDGMASNVVRNLISFTHPSEYQIKGIHQNTIILKTRYVEEKSNHPFIRVDEYEHLVERIKLDDKLMDLIEESDCIIVSDYDKGFICEEDLNIISKNSKFSVLDSKKKLSKTTIMNFDFVKLNENEFLNNYTKDVEILEKLIITLGSNGAKYKEKHYPSDSPKETIDVSGAGDTFTAAFSKKYMETKDIEVSITYANKLATLVVHKRGVSIP